MMEIYVAEILQTCKKLWYCRPPDTAGKNWSRNQYVSINDHDSSLAAINCDVSQVSVD